MATIRVCDWTKQRLAKDEQAYEVTIGDQTFEVGEEGYQLLLGQLEREDQPEVSQPVAAPVPKDPAPPTLESSDQMGLDLQAADDPFEVSSTGNVAEKPADPVDAEDVPPLEIPDDIRKGFKTPSPATAQRIIEDATKFEEGSLPSLTMGARAQKDAQKRLRALEEKQEGNMKRKAGKGVRFNARIDDLM